MTPSNEANNNRIPTTSGSARETGIWLGIALGVAVGIGVAISRRKRSRWDTVRALPQQVSRRSGELAEVTRDLAGRVASLYEQSRRLVEDAGALWQNGRKMVGY